MASIALVSADADWQEKERNYTVVYRVIADFRVGPIAVMNAVGINMYDAYVNPDTGEYDTGARVKKITPTPDAEDGKEYLVTYSYGYVSNPYSNPLSEPVKITIDGESSEVHIDYDVKTGAAIVNAAGEPYPEPLTTNKRRSVISFTRNEADYDEALSYYYSNTTNLYDWHGVPSGCAMLSKRRAEQQFNQDIGFYYSVTYEVVVDLDGFKKKVLNAGLRNINWTPPRLTPCLDEDRNPVTTPVLLLRNGRQAPKNSTPIYNEYHVANESDWPSVFGI